MREINFIYLFFAHQITKFFIIFAVIFIASKFEVVADKKMNFIDDELRALKMNKSDRVKREI